MEYNLLSFGISDVGFVRQNNEDAWVAYPEENFYIVADGMGGHLAGEVAAEEAINALSKYIREMKETAGDLSFEEAQGAVHYAMAETNAEVFEISQTKDEYRGMGTTLCCLYFHDAGLIYGHIGDSRIYRFRGNLLNQLTRDHSLVAELTAKGNLSDMEVAEMGLKNVITKAVGTGPIIDPSVDITEVECGDIYFMCTDGLTDMLSFEEIQKILQEHREVEPATTALVDAAKEMGGVDNITVVMVQVV